MVQASVQLLVCFLAASVSDMATASSNGSSCAINIHNDKLKKKVIYCLFNLDLSPFYYFS